MNDNFKTNVEHLTGGTFLQGYITTTYDNLVKVFGPPDYHDNCGDKVTCEWSIQFGDGTVATIYDWKMGRTPKNSYQWHIGGTDKQSVRKVSETLGIQGMFS